jgi:hypothetical protein
LAQFDQRDRRLGSSLRPDLGDDMNSVSFLAGIAAAAFLASAIFFLKFWKVSRDRFFLHFSVACALLSLERVLLLYMLPDIQIVQRPPEAHAWVYLVRMAAFLLIMWAFIQRNRAGGRQA